MDFTSISEQFHYCHHTNICGILQCVLLLTYLGATYSSTENIKKKTIVNCSSTEIKRFSYYGNCVKNVTRTKNTDHNSQINKTNKMLKYFKCTAMLTINRSFAHLWSVFDRAKPTFKMLLAFWNFYTILNGVRPLNAKNLESVGQRTTKISAIKLWEWFDPEQTRIWADSFKWGWGQAANFVLRLSTLTAGNF